MEAAFSERTMSAVVTLGDVNISTIRPFEKTDHPAFLEPSLYDLLPLDAYIPWLFLYKPEGVKSDAFKLADHLKTSLSKVLVSFYPFAGRWLKTNDGRKRLLHCTDEGVPFIEASVNEDMQSVVNVTDFKGVEDLGGHRLLGMDPTLYAQTVHSPAPVLFVQLTRFKCGGVALQFNLSHMTADGTGSFIFLEALSQIALHGRSSIVPIHDRSLITSPNLEMNENTVRDDTSEPAIADPGALMSPVFDTTLHVRRDVILDLKKKAADANLVVSTADLVTAHLCHSFNNNKISESTEKEAPATAYSVVDIRKRASFPEKYVGNAAILAMLPEISPTESCTQSELISTANAIGQTLRAVNRSTWQDVMAKSFRTMGKPSPNSRQVCISSVIRSPVNEISFGSGFGKPIWGGSNSTIRLMPKNVLSFPIFAPCPALSKIAVASIQMLVPAYGLSKALLSDEKFLSFFHRTP